jgi:hypothetical protein
MFHFACGTSTPRCSISRAASAGATGTSKAWRGTERPPERLDERLLTGPAGEECLVQLFRTDAAQRNLLLFREEASGYAFDLEVGTDLFHIDSDSSPGSHRTACYPTAVRQIETERVRR